MTLVLPPWSALLVHGGVLLAGLGAGWIVGTWGAHRRHRGSHARLAADLAQVTAIARTHDVTWPRPGETPYLAWPVVPGWDPRVFFLPLPRGLAEMDRELTATAAETPGDLHVTIEFKITQNSEGTWKERLPRYWGNKTSSYRYFQGPLSRVREEIGVFFRDPTSGFCNVDQVGTPTWALPGSALRLCVTLRRVQPWTPPVQVVEVLLERDEAPVPGRPALPGPVGPGTPPSPAEAWYAALTQYTGIPVRDETQARAAIRALVEVETGEAPGPVPRASDPGNPGAPGPCHHR